MGFTLNPRTCSCFRCVWERDLGHVRRRRVVVLGVLVSVVELCRVLGLVSGGRAEVAVVSFSVSPPTLGSIVSRSRTASRTAFGRRLRRSPPAILDPVPDRERFGLYRVGGEGVAQRIQLGAGLGVWLVVRGRLGAGRVTSSPLI